MQSDASRLALRLAGLALITVFGSSIYPSDGGSFASTGRLMGGSRLAEAVKEEKVLAPPLEKYVPPPGMTKQQIVDEFHKLIYSAAWEENLSWHRTQWFGFPLLKMPSDLFLLADVIWQIKPALIIETGTAMGGSALFMASYLDMMGQGKVATIDIKPIDRAYPAHPRIAYFGGKSSLDEGLLKEMRERVAFYGGPVMVILDSDHAKDHVLEELAVYADFVTPGSYLVVEDTNVNGRPVLAEHGPGPGEALDEWLPGHPEFKLDERLPRYHLLSAHAWLRKRKG